MVTKMLSAPLLDPTGALITELRADAALSALVGTRIAAGEPAPGWSQGAGSYQAFVVLVGAPAPDARVPISRASYTARCYASTHQQATAVWGALVAAVHGAGPRLKGSGLGIYRTWLLPDADQLRDPDTNQPYTEGTIQLIATAQAVS